MAHLFICPNCGNRSSATERTAGFRNTPKGCSKCGFGFLFELLDDYYPAPNAAFFVCDREGRIVKGGLVLMGRPAEIDDMARTHERKAARRQIEDAVGGLRFDSRRRNLRLRRDLYGP